MSNEQISYHCSKCKAKCSPPEPGRDYVVCPICNRQTMSAFALRVTMTVERKRAPCDGGECGLGGHCNECPELKA